jgi:hypothetical protein
MVQSLLGFDFTRGGTNEQKDLLSEPLAKFHGEGKKRQGATKGVFSAICNSAAAKAGI